MEHCRPKRPGDTTGAGRVWTDQVLARNGGDQSTCVLVAGQSVGSCNKGFDEAELCPGWQAEIGSSKLSADGGLSTRGACSKCRFLTGNVRSLQLHKQRSGDLSHIFNTCTLLHRCVQLET
jgi:hypothetical protein